MCLVQGIKSSILWPFPSFLWFKETETVQCIHRTWNTRTLSVCDDIQLKSMQCTSIHVMIRVWNHKPTNCSRGQWWKKYCHHMHKSAGVYAPLHGVNSREISSNEAKLILKSFQRLCSTGQTYIFRNQFVEIDICKICAVGSGRKQIWIVHVKF